jgi:hypothetical protein
MSNIPHFLLHSTKRESEEDSKYSFSQSYVKNEQNGGTGRLPSHFLQGDDTPNKEEEFEIPFSALHQKEFQDISN